VVACQFIRCPRWAGCLWRLPCPEPPRRECLDSDIAPGLAESLRIGHRHPQSHTCARTPLTTNANDGPHRRDPWTDTEWHSTVSRPYMGGGMHGTGKTTLTISNCLRTNAQPIRRPCNKGRAGKNQTHANRTHLSRAQASPALITIEASMLRLREVFQRICRATALKLHLHDPREFRKFWPSRISILFLALNWRHRIANAKEHQLRYPLPSSDSGRHRTMVDQFQCKASHARGVRVWCLTSLPQLRNTPRLAVPRCLDGSLTAVSL
jgi:hypothetical protein